MRLLDFVADYREPQYHRWDQDKYAFVSNVEIDCEARIPYCRAVCCKLTFCYSRQDVDEGALEWNPAAPFRNLKGEDGRCVHQDRSTGFCSVHEIRPIPCRYYDCSRDERIWLDFERMIPRPEVERDDWPWSLDDGVSPFSDEAVAGEEDGE